MNDFDVRKWTLITFISSNLILISVHMFTLNHFLNLCLEVATFRHTKTRSRNSNVNLNRIELYSKLNLFILLQNIVYFLLIFRHMQIILQFRQNAY